MVPGDAPVATAQEYVIPHKAFYFMRHGQTDWNVAGKWQGRRHDIPLNQQGEQQAVDAAALLKHLRFDHIIHSPLLRAAKTAHLVNVHGAALKAISCLEEFDCGVEKQEVVAPPRHVVAHMMDTHTVHGMFLELSIFRQDMEAFEDFELRIRRGLCHALEHEGLVLIVAHGVVWRMVCTLLGIPPFRLPNCAVVHVNPPDAVFDSWTCRIVE